MIWVYAFVVSAVIGLAWGRRHWLVKILPILVLIGLALDRIADPIRWWVVAALALSAVGDVALAAEERNERLFLYGLASFLFAHLAYVGAFRADAGFDLGWSWLIVPAAAIVTIWLWPDLGAYRLPVLGYVTVITVMVVSALARRPFLPAVGLGAVFFMISDLLIAVDRFKFEIKARHYSVMGTYYLAQGLIVFGLT